MLNVYVRDRKIARSHVLRGRVRKVCRCSICSSRSLNLLCLLQLEQRYLQMLRFQMAYLKISEHRLRRKYYLKGCLILIVVRRGFTSPSYYSALTLYSGDSSSACSCKAGGACQCCTPRKTAPKRRRKSTATDDQHSSRNSPVIEQSIPSSQVLARIAELRPVLPRPPKQLPYAVRPTHDPSSESSHPTRHHIRDDLLYSPYGRAYNTSHAQEHALTRNDSQGHDSSQDFSQNILGFNGSPHPPDIPFNVQSWLSTSESFPSACKCGDQCACPGCFEHSGAQASEPSAHVFSLCANPGACSHCLDCTILSLPSSVLPNTAPSIYDSSEADSIDEWIRQISAQADSNTTMSLPPNLAMTPNNTPWESYQLPSLSESIGGALSECCGGRCKCPVGSCTCPLDCCGCCQGCECIEHETNPSMGVVQGSSTTFATSRERGACCSGGMKQATRSLESFELQASRNDPQGSHRRMSHGTYLEIPDVHRNRSSSTSSHAPPIYPMDSHHLFATPRPQLPKGLPSSSGSSSSTSSAQNFIPSPDMDIYASSAPDSEHSSSDDQHYESYSRRDPSSELEGMQLY